MSGNLKAVSQQNQAWMNVTLKDARLIQLNQLNLQSPEKMKSNRNPADNAITEQEQEPEDVHLSNRVMLEMQ